MNNKGFAITTMLYGTLMIAVIVVFTLASLTTFSKREESDFVDSVEEELIGTSTKKPIHDNFSCSNWYCIFYSFCVRMCFYG